MNVFYRLLLLTCFIATTTVVMAQQETDTSSTPLVGVTIHADSRLALLTAPPKAKTNAGSRSGMIRSGRGFRVQIYNGNDRVKATKMKLDFMRRFPGVRTYMTYIQPQFRVKVGDFRTRSEAQKMYQQLSTLYSPVMIVPDIIVINTLRDDQ
jgi:hypothetical protein